MNPNIIALEAIQIAKPCRADWHRMTGDERARFCGSCHKNVYDISQMTRAQAHQLIAEREGDLCLRLHRRSDGTVITSDCPVGIVAKPRPLWWGAVATMVALVGAGLAGCAAPTDAPAPISPVLSNGNQNVETQQTVRRAPPIQVETPTMEFGNVEPVPITNGSASNGQHPSVTLGAPMMPKPTPQPTNAPTLGEPTLGEPTLGRIAIKPTMGKPKVPSASAQVDMGAIAPVCEPPAR